MKQSSSSEANSHSDSQEITSLYRAWTNLFLAQSSDRRMTKYVKSLPVIPTLPLAGDEVKICCCSSCPAADTCKEDVCCCSVAGLNPADDVAIRCCCCCCWMDWKCCNCCCNCWSFCCCKTCNEYVTILTNSWLVQWRSTNLKLHMLVHPIHPEWSVTTKINPLGQ